MTNKTKFLDELLEVAKGNGEHASLCREMADLVSEGTIEGLLKFHNVALDAGPKYMEHEVTAQLAELLDPIVKQADAFEVARHPSTNRPNIPFIVGVRGRDSKLNLVGLRFFSTNAIVFLNPAERTICTRFPLPMYMEMCRTFADDKEREGNHAEAAQARQQARDVELMTTKLPMLAEALEPYGFKMQDKRWPEANK